MLMMIALNLLLKEVLITSTKPMVNQNINLPDYECEPSTVKEQKKYVLSHLLAQMELASAICMESPFFSVLRKRQLILHRTLYALNAKFHDRVGYVSVRIASCRKMRVICHCGIFA